MAKSSAIEENNSLMGQKMNTSDEDTSFRKFLYNKERGTCLGRDAKSWAQITIFYIIFYTCLAAFWVACLAIFLNTLDANVPRYYGKGTIIGINPGVGYQPWLKENPDSTLVKFNVRDPESYKPYVDQLDTYLAKYSNLNNTRDCSKSGSNSDVTIQGSDDRVPACLFSLADFEKAGCSAANDYGYKSGTPCIVLSLNRLIGWNPVDYPVGSIPEEVKDRYRNGSIAINCDGSNTIAKEHVGKRVYLPPHGIDGKYYPYSVMSNYHQPIAMVRFDSLPRNKLVLVECRAYALNIEHDIPARLGLVHFELFVQDMVPVTVKE